MRARCFMQLTLAGLAHFRDLQSSCECWKNLTKHRNGPSKKRNQGAPGPKKEVATKEAAYGGAAVVRASSAHWGYWQEPDLTMKAGGACAGILLLGTDPKME